MSSHADNIANHTIALVQKKAAVNDIVQKIEKAVNTLASRSSEFGKLISKIIENLRSNLTLVSEEDAGKIKSLIDILQTNLSKNGNSAPMVNANANANSARAAEAEAAAASRGDTRGP